MPTSEAFDPFDTFDVLILPRFENSESNVWTGFNFDDRLESKFFSVPDADRKPLSSLQSTTFQLDFEDVRLPSTDVSSAVSFVSAEETTAFKEESSHIQDEASEDDIWRLDEIESAKQVQLTSWDHFENELHIEPPTAFLSEASRTVLDGVFQLAKVNVPSSAYANEDELASALFELGLGRSSQYFTWVEGEQRFASAIEDLGLSGFSADILQSVTKLLNSHGAKMRTQSEAFTGHIHRRDTSSPGQHALLAALRSCHAAIEHYLQEQRAVAQTILAISYVFQTTSALLDILKTFRVLIEDDPDDQELLSKVLTVTSSMALEHPCFERLLQAVCAMVALPVLNQISVGVGLASMSGSDDYMSVPHAQNDSATILPSDVVQIVSENHDNLSLLQKLAPTTARLLQASDHISDLKLVFSFQDIIDVQSSAQAFEKQVTSKLTASANMSSQTSTHGQHLSNYDVSEESCWNLLSLEIEPKETALPNDIMTIAAGSLGSACNEKMSSYCVSYDQALSMSITPMLAAQHRLLSYSVFEVLFLEHNLLKHLNLLHQISLFGDGLFASRLGTALFDSEQNSGEAHRHGGGITGLRLQARDIWPPASSELRLALMGILTEFLGHSASSDIGESISFAVRDLSDEELDKCLDVNSIHALDFLKMQYRAPSLVLEAMISAETLDKYDKIFRHLLRVLRLKFVAGQLLRLALQMSESRDTLRSRRFAIEIQHFISVVADYCQNIAIGEPWTSFVKTMRAVEQNVRARNYDATLRLGQSLRYLARLHEATLDTMLRALMLKQKQTKMLQALETVFDVVLRYAAMVREPDVTDTTGSKIEHTYKVFNSTVRKLVVSLQSMHDGNGRFKSSSKEEGLELLEHLLLRLNMNEYWTR